MSQPLHENGVVFSDCTCIGSTEKAILVEIPDLGERVWIPQSQVHENSEVWKRGDQGELVVTQWFAEQRGWV